MSTHFSLNKIPLYSPKNETDTEILLQSVTNSLTKSSNSCIMWINQQNRTGGSNMETRKYLYKHTSQENAYIVENYPWGFRLKTTIRYWVETKNRKNCGQRFGRQTINPKTGIWCAPKYSTYSPIIVMYLNEDEHIKFCTSNNYCDDEMLNKFKEDHWLNLDDYQKNALKKLIAYNEFMKKVSWKCTVSAIKMQEETS